MTQFQNIDCSSGIIFLKIEALEVPETVLSVNV
ncbi:uncharacterized protein METZ01_LOCUS340490 [marine metagenome]|uniref:Uncharacterized protein n=1 Tax=marine metagenome TaxID=408172 RepID=A0A382QQB3_9ZZZZ